MKRAVTCSFVLFVVLACLAGAASASALTPDGSSGWYWQMPQPTGDLQALSAISMPSSTQSWAVGDGGLIYHSADAGVTWAQQTSGTTADLWSVEFVDDHDGWAFGGVLLRTTDAGATWTAATPTGVKELISLSAVGPDECWLGTTSGELLHTVDGGATWQARRLSADGFLSADFTDAAHGWAMGTRSRLWRTQDAGVTWKLVTSTLPSGGWFSRVSFTDPDHGWLQEYSRKTRIYTTSDAGVSWRRVLTLGDDSFEGPMLALDATHALLAEQRYQDLPFDTPPVSYLRRTDDGGVTWTRISAGSTPLGSFAASGDTLISLGESGPARSTDGGTTWTSSISQGGYAFSAAQAVSPTDIWATDWNGALLHSGDGLHWQEQPDPMRWSITLRGLSFPDAANGWLVGNEPGIFFDFFGRKPVLLHTTDGGGAWRRETSPLGGALTGIDFIDAQHGWVVADTSQYEVARTVDGGLTWTLQRVPGQVQLESVDFIDAQHGWVAGSYDKRIGPHSYTRVGGIFATADGGASWHRQDIPGRSGTVDQVRFLDTANGWAVAQGARRGWVAHTTDGGQTWTRLAGFAHTSFSSILFTDAAHGWLGGYFEVRTTSDGGATWQRVASSGYNTIVAASDPQHVWGFGDGTLVSTVDGDGDLAAPTTLDDADWDWHGSPLTVHLWPSDIGGSGLAGTDYSLDGGATWQTGTSVDFPAPKDHSTDGRHRILYRSRDIAGNVEATKRAEVSIDTLGPRCAVPWETVVNAGSKGILRFKAKDVTSGVARAVISISDRRGRVVARIVRHSGNWDQYPRPPYFWIRFTADLEPGAYRVTVTAEDQAGNVQVTAGHNRLRVVRSGAPVQRAPHWEQGLPENYFLAGGLGAPSARAAATTTRRATASRE